MFTLIVFAGVVRFERRRRRRAPADFLPPLSLFKPLHGSEPDLDAHLATFFEQDYPLYEILFCARTSDDPGLEIAQRVARRYPHIPAQFLSIVGPAYVNAKVSSLERMAEAAAHEIFVISDSDVRVMPAYLREVAVDFADPQVGANTCLYRGVARRGFWAQLEAAGMSVEMTSGVMAASILEQMGFLLGPTMAVRRRCVEQMGGFKTLGDYCSDDFLLGHAVAAGGAKVVLSGHVIDHIILNLSFATSVKHQIRWMRSTRFSRPKGHLGTGLTFSLPYGMLGASAALALGHPRWAAALLLYSVLSRIVLAALVAGRVVHDPEVLRASLLFPLRDLMGFVYWAASYTGGTILWRGKVYRLGEQGRMSAAGD